MKDHEVKNAHESYSNRLNDYQNNIIDKLIAYKENYHDGLKMSIASDEDISPTAYIMTVLGFDVLLDFTIAPCARRTDIYYGRVNCYLDINKDSILHSFYFDHYGSIFSKHPDEEDHEEITFNVENKIIIVISKAIIKQL